MRRMLGLAALGAMEAANFLWEEATKQRKKRLNELEKRRHEAEEARLNRDPKPPQTVYVEGQDSSPTWQERIVHDEEA